MFRRGPAGAALLALVALGGAPLTAQSLADVARQEAARRKAIKKPAKVLTDKDLKEPPPATPAPPPAPAAPDASAGAKDADKSTTAAPQGQEPVKDQKYWAGRVKALQDRLDRDQVLADAMQSRINALNTDFVNRDDPAQRAQIERDRQRAIAELGRLQQQVTDDKKALADLNEEARRAGVPPGWLR